MESLTLIEARAYTAEKRATFLLWAAPPKSPQSARRENEGKHRRHSERVKGPDEQEVSIGFGELASKHASRSHHMKDRQGLYQPLSVAEQNASWEQDLRESNTRPTPPPMIPSKSPDNSQQGFNPWAIPNDELRAMAIREQLGEKGR